MRARLHRDGPSADAVERTRARALTGFYGGLRTANGKASSLGEYETTGGDYRMLFAIPEVIRRVTAADLQVVARRYLHPEQRTVIIAEPDERSAAMADEEDEDEDDAGDDDGAGGAP